MINELTRFLELNGFGKIMTNLPEFVFFFRQERQSVNVLLVIDYRPEIYLTNDQYVHIKEGIYRLFAAKGVSEVHILALVLCEERERVLSISGEDRFCWQIAPMQRRLYIYENQVPDFYGIKGMLEQFLEQEQWECAAGGNMENRTAAGQKSGFPIVNISIVVINIILYLICTWGTNLLYNIWDLVGTAVFEEHEYYRIVTSMFLHVGVSHLFSNMLVLYFLGEILEKEMGHIKYAALYFLSGIGAAFVSMGYQYAIHDFNGSVGASGAIYGILGALLWLVIIHKGRYRDATLPRILFFLAYSLYSGFQSTNVDNAAHIGGLISGFLITILLWRRSRVNEG